MNRTELIALAKENGVKKAHQTKTTVLEEMLTEMGVIGNKVERRGRPVNPDSERQKRLAQFAAKAEANNGVVPRGRPVDPTSPRQIRLAELEAKKAANGGVIPRGRPKKDTDNTEEASS